CRYLARESRISSAVFFHTNGLGLSFHVAIQSRTSCSRPCTLVWTLRRSSCEVSRPNQRSTWLIQDEPVGVKWTWKRGWRASHSSIAGVLWVERLSHTMCTSNSAGTALSMVTRNFLYSAAR